MSITTYMNKDIQLCSPKETIRSAAQIMHERGACALPIGDGRKIDGMLTDRDIVVHAVALGLPPATPVGNIMDRAFCYCFEDESFEDVAEQMKDMHIICMPVVDRNRHLVGMISWQDILRIQKGKWIGQANGYAMATGNRPRQN
jgi:CBS domain-containing protein